MNKKRRPTFKLLRPTAIEKQQYIPLRSKRYARSSFGQADIKLIRARAKSRFRKWYAAQPRKRGLLPGEQAIEGISGVGRAITPTVAGMQKRLQQWKGPQPSRKPPATRLAKELQSDVKFKIKMKKRRRDYFDAVEEQAKTLFG